MRCENCKQACENDDIFCGYCGVNLIVALESVKKETENESSGFVNQSRDFQVNSIKHPKEKMYGFWLNFFSTIFWVLPIGLFLFVLYSIGLNEKLIGILFYVIIAILVLIIPAWIAKLFFKAFILGSSVKVSKNQFSEINKMLNEYSEQLVIDQVPECFIVSSHHKNALATRFLSSKYILLNSELVDLLMIKNRNDELSFIVGHEIGHFAAGHLSVFGSIFSFPAKLMIPFLATAYQRSCELTADRIGYLLNGNLSASKNALIALAHGSHKLADMVNSEEFMKQDFQIPWLMGFIQKIFSSHPRLTKRVIELSKFHQQFK